MKEGAIVKMFKSNKVNNILMSLMVMAILLCSSSPVQADQSGDYTYTITNGKAEIMKYKGAGGVVTIPTTLGGISVTSIGKWAFLDCSGLNTIIIPQGVTSIGDGAFWYCNVLTTINIP
ncbi:leucine-rich repeat protein [Clostridium tagluense]|uniref:leucine-rich repeat protein n=1 Tax=Clostridium tagluense TaxID=360422 RepID=UPI001CF2EB8D|nr:leucine-rich repeat domain-containing protein [Clostridium tagluense]MCB2300098.1 leucine-rich repeat domain-containing protein [Clostridium tagluense]